MSSRLELSMVTKVNLTGNLSVSNTIVILLILNLLSLFMIEAFGYHGLEISLTLNSAELTKVSLNENATRLRVSLNYTVNDPSVVNQTINSVMKVYHLNGTLLKTSSAANGFNILNNTGTHPHVTILANSTTQNLEAVVQFTDLSKTVPISNPIQVELKLTQIQAEISAFPR
jgi:hypothetical protein